MLFGGAVYLVDRPHASTQSTTNLSGRQSTFESTIYHSLPVDGRLFTPQRGVVKPFLECDRRFFKKGLTTPSSEHGQLASLREQAVLPLCKGTRCAPSRFHPDTPSLPRSAQLSRASVCANTLTRPAPFSILCARADFHMRDHPCSDEESA